MRILAIRAFSVFTASVLLAVSSSAATRYAPLYNFTGGNDGGNPATGLAFDSAGNAYGTTVVGGGFGCGTVFKLHRVAPSQWQQSVIWNFDCFGGGKNPYGGVTINRDGNLFGVTAAGGSGGICSGDGCGEVYEITPTGSGIRILHSFKGGADGFGPGGSVAFDAAGNIFGTTPDGGVFSAGVVYELKRVSGGWRYQVIHNFGGGTSGGVGSLGSLLLDSAGNLSGVTELFGAHNAGTVYRMVRSSSGSWIFTTLYAFRGQPDAGSPYGGLIADASGDLYGTTYFGGANGVGAVFELVPNHMGGWTDRVLYSFKGAPDGSYPTSTLVFDAAGNLFGSTSMGGSTTCDCGTVFELSAGSFTESIVHRFGSGTDGSFLYYGLTPDATGTLFSTTKYGGLNGQGTVFKFRP